jgi:transposase
MGMRLLSLEITGEERAELERRVRSNTVEARVARRARIVLLAGDGLSNRAIGERVGMHYNQVGEWRSRFQVDRLAGLLDGDRPGRCPTYGHDDVLLLVKTVTEDPPDEATRWTMAALAGRMAEQGVPISASQAWRICRALDLKPWQVQSWMTSHDPDFWEKSGDVCGLYLNPPENALVWSVDEKTGIQAKSRINPTRPAVPAEGAVEKLRPAEPDTTPAVTAGPRNATASSAAGGAGRAEGIPVRREFEYQRNGTVKLYAALNVHEGTVAGWVTDSTRSANFVAFLQDLVDQTPPGLELHCIVDNLSAHGTALVEAFLDSPENHHVFLHRTPTHASWLNQVELWFSIMERRLLRRGEFSSTDQLADRIIEFIKAYNRQAKPFRWTHEGRPLKVA